MIDEQSVLVVVDMQNDFISGALGTPEARAIVETAIELIDTFPGEVTGTRDTHDEGYLSTQEGANLPVRHCIRNTPGWRAPEAVQRALDARAATLFEKAAFASLDLAEHLRRLDAERRISRIELIGLCTDICVVSNALLIKAVLPEVPLAVRAACCAGVTPETHAAALATMASCQIGIV